ncbi:hypothetical protein BU14_2586s0001, partial [Porphyra umbilicalis]
SCLSPLPTAPHPLPASPCRRPLRLKRPPHPSPWALCPARASPPHRPPPPPPRRWRARRSGGAAAPVARPQRPPPCAPPAPCGTSTTRPPRSRAPPRRPRPTPQRPPAMTHAPWPRLLWRQPSTCSAAPATLPPAPPRCTPR